jgi:hypothetical protein
MKKKNIFTIALMVGAVIGVTFFIMFKVFSFAKNAKENIELTKQMSPVLLEMLKQKNISDFPYQPAPIQWEGKFLQVDNGVVPDTPLGIVEFVYNKQRNEALNTQRFFSSSDINGIVWLSQNVKIVGEYDGGGQAFQPYYVLSFLDLNRQAILSQDVVWGGMPPQTTSSHSGASGNNPDEKEVIKLIQEKTQN